MKPARVPSSKLIRLLLATFLVTLTLSFLGRNGHPALAQDYTWHTQTVDSSGRWDTSLAFDPQGNPAISYMGNDDLKFARRTGTSWTIQTVDRGWLGTSLAFDSQGNPAISYCDLVNCDLKCARWTGIWWIIPTVDSAVGVGEYSSLAFDPQGNPAISYCDTSNGDLKFARWTGTSWTSWTIQTVDSAGDVGGYSSLAFDFQGNPAISYYDASNDDLKFARWTGTSWNIQTVDSTGDVGWDTSLAFDPQGNPAISYCDTSNGDLKFARWTGTSWTSWTIQTVDSAGDVGRYSSLAFDFQGNPVISYYDRSNGDLKFARWTGTSWTIQTVDSAGDVGRDTSLAFDPQGNPAISYCCGAGNGGLKFASADIIPAPTLTLSSPATDARTNDTTPTLDWSDVSGPSGVSYGLQIDDSPDLSSPLVSKTGLTSSQYSLTSGEALPEGIYYWRVKAADGAGQESGWTASWYFTVDTTAPGAPALLSPPTGKKTNDITPTLDWSDASDPSGVRYGLQIDDSSDLSSPLVNKTGIASSQYSLAPGEALPEGIYYWRVKAIDGVGNEGGWSERWFFQIEAGKSPMVPLLIGLIALLVVIGIPLIVLRLRKGNLSKVPPPEP